MFLLLKHLDSLTLAIAYAATFAQPSFWGILFTLPAEKLLLAFLHTQILL